MILADVLAAALVLNRKTQEEAQIADGAPEVVAAANRTLHGIYQIGARVNPGYHGKIQAVAEASGVWARPADAELLTRIEDSEGVEVIRTTPEEPIPDPEKPCLVRWGRSYRRPAGAAAPTGSLNFWYSRRPTALLTLAGEVDLEDAFISLLVYDLGAWLAHRDERWDELQLVIAERDRYFQLYVASLEHESVGDVRNVGQTATFDTPSLVDLKSLLFNPTPRKAA